MPERSSTWDRFYLVVRRVPRGRVATYGQIARLAGLPRHARHVGYALAALDGASDVPWHRVVDAAGRVKLRATPGADRLQRARLEREGVRFDAGGRIDLARHGWSAAAEKSVGPAGKGSAARAAAARSRRASSR